MQELAVYELEHAWRQGWVSSGKPTLDCPGAAFVGFSLVVIRARRCGRDDQRTRDGAHEV